MQGVFVATGYELLSTVPTGDIPLTKVLRLKGVTTTTPLTFRVSIPVTDVAMKAVVASFVLLSPGAGVGAVGVPVSAGEAKGASKASAAKARVFSTPTALSAYAVVAIFVELSSALAVGAVGVPVKAGLANKAIVLGA